MSPELEFFIKVFYVVILGGFTLVAVLFVGIFGLWAICRVGRHFMGK